MFRSLLLATALVAVSSDPTSACSYKDQKNCDGDSKCSWCDAGAVPPACHTIEDAKKLPPAVFYCDKLNATSIEKEFPANVDCGDCGKAYQGCCVAFGIKGFPCNCHLQAGSGKAEELRRLRHWVLRLLHRLRRKGYPCQCDVA